MSEATTQGIRVSVETEFLEEESSRNQGHFLFAYHITVLNLSEVTAQLVSRCWEITDSEGRQEEVRGPGVVGEQPVLKPGDSFRYTSYCPLPTAVGTMEGFFRMIPETGDVFDARVAPFTLAVPGSVN